MHHLPHLRSRQDFVSDNILDLQPLLDAGQDGRNTMMEIFMSFLTMLIPWSSSPPLFSHMVLGFFTTSLLPWRVPETNSSRYKWEHDSAQELLLCIHTFTDLFSALRNHTARMLAGGILGIMWSNLLLNEPWGENKIPD